MKSHIRWYKIKNVIRYQWTMFLSFFVLLLLFGVIFSYYKRFNEEIKSAQLLSSEVEMLKNRYDTLKYNKTLTADQIKEYNKLLVELIPESEDFFSIIVALDKISADSHFMVTDYVLNMKDSGKDKLTITVMGNGDTEAFRSFLEKYQFGGGRLITSNKIEYGGTTSTDTKITLNFYSKRFAFNETLQVGLLSQAELDRLNSIRKKISMQYISSQSTIVDTDYTTKKDPFSQ